VVATLVVLPYFLLMIAWAASNPSAAAPDEPAHLIKALGMARLDIGRPAPPAPTTAPRIIQRNASIGRVVEIPQRLNPRSYYSCFAFRPKQTAACQPQHPSTSSGSGPAVSDVGSYPPFLYVPIGLVARIANTVPGAFLGGRLVGLCMVSVLLWLAVYQLVRWIGRRALLGVFVAITPTVVFTGSAVGLSGVETASALAVACVAVSATRRPESLRDPTTHAVFGVAGCVLILSRQLGPVTFGCLMVYLVCNVRPRRLVVALRPLRLSLVLAVAAVVCAAAAMVWWEHGYDHPIYTGSFLNERALPGFGDDSYIVLRSAIGVFGWMDTFVFRWMYVAWILIAVVVVGAAVIMARASADRWSLVVWLLALLFLAYGTYSSVFYPIQAGEQGRHFLPFAMLVFVLAGVALMERLDPELGDVYVRLVRLIAVVIPVLQFGGLWLNARRYAVGSDGPILFLGSARWSPRFGWEPWLGIGAGAALVLGATILKTVQRPNDTVLTSTAGEETLEELRDVAR
jgi:Predicted membrane protein (DUF2142)